tara:strand:+ start:328 stop:531 length:204 start_codon:yes stop_codon:yes gene_type:complete
MEAQAVALIIGSIGGLIASVIYSLKHIRKSECCGNKCTQDTMECGGCENIIIKEIQNTQTSTKQTEI